MRRTAKAATAAAASHLGLLVLALALLLPAAHAFVVPTTAGRAHQRRSLMSMMAAPRERVTITVSTLPDGYTLRGTYYSLSGGQQESWMLTKTYQDIEQWSYLANKRLGYSLPPLPPQELCTVLTMEDFLNKCVRLEPLWRSQDDLAFFAVPRALLEEDEEDATPTYKPDVYDVDGTPLRGEVRDQQDVKKAATIAGGVAGFFIGGPFGAMLGAAAANAASQREDGVGDVARTAGKAANVAIRQAQKLDARYDITGKAKDALKKGFSGIKAAVDSLDEASSS